MPVACGKNGVLWMYDVCGCLAVEDYGGVVISSLESGAGKIKGRKAAALRLQ